MDDGRAADPAGAALLRRGAARAAVAFSCDAAGRTYVRRQFAPYPFHVCRPFYVAGDPPQMATLYVQSCSGGIYQDDDLAIDVMAEEGAQVHLTSQASTIVHAMERGDARHAVSLEAQAGAVIEYLPDPLILFPRVRLTTCVRIRAHPTSTVVACESFLLHDPEGGKGAFDRLLGETIAESSDGDLLALDRFEIVGDTMTDRRPGITGAHPALGSMLVLHREGRAALVEALRSALDAAPGIYGGASALPGDAGAWVRLLAEDGAALRRGLHAVWSAVRRTLTGAAPQARRK